MQKFEKIKTIADKRIALAKRVDTPTTKVASRITS